jgi:hypothetical protein
MASTSVEKPSPPRNMDSLQKLGAASTAYTRTLAEAQQQGVKRYQALLNDLAEEMREVAEDRTAADLVTRYQLEVVRRLRTHDASGLQQQYVDTVQQLLKLQERHVAKLRSAIESLQTNAEELAAKSRQAAAAAAQHYTEAVKLVADDDGLREIDPASLAQWGCGVLMAASLRARQIPDG